VRFSHSACTDAIGLDKRRIWRPISAGGSPLGDHAGVNSGIAARMLGLMVGSTWKCMK